MLIRFNDDDELEIKLDDPKNLVHIRIGGAFTKLELPDIDARIYGCSEEISKVVNMLLSNGSEELKNVLKDISKFKEDLQESILSVLIERGIDAARDAISVLWRYNEFVKRRFEYNDDQLLLDTGILIIFDEAHKTAKIYWTSLNNDTYYKWVNGRLSQSQLYAEDYLKYTDAALLASAKPWIPEKYHPIVDTLSLISQFAPRKQEKLLKKMPLSNEEIEQLQEALRKRERARERKERYIEAYHEKFSQSVYYNTVTKELMIRSARWKIWGKVFLLVTYDSTIKIYEITVRDATARHEEIIGRWILTGKMSKSKDVVMVQLDEQDLQQYLGDLREAEKVEDLPFKDKLLEYLIYLKLRGKSK